jgi:hypothetical protein
MNEVHMSEELFFAVSAKSASLLTRRGRPLYATRTQWEEWSDALPVSAYVSAMVRPATGDDRLIFGALPLDEGRGGTDLIDAVITAVSNLTVDDLNRLIDPNARKGIDWVGGAVPPVCPTCGVQHVDTCSTEVAE